MKAKEELGFVRYKYKVSIIIEALDRWFYKEELQMKKQWKRAGALLAAGVLMLTGCGNAKENNEGGDVTNEASPKPTEAAVTPGEGKQPTEAPTDTPTE